MTMATLTQEAPASHSTNRAPAARRCIVTRAPAPRSGLVRFVRGPDDAVVADVAEKLPGRGVWVGAEAGLVHKAVKNNLFARAFHGPARAAADLPATVERALAGRCLDYLGLAARAGQVVAGYENVSGLVRAGEAAAVLAAHDAAPGGRAKIAALAGAIRVIELFARAELSLALGRENVVHAALRPGGLAEHFLRESARLSGFRPTPAAAQAHRIS